MRHSILAMPGLSGASTSCGKRADKDVDGRGSARMHAPPRVTVRRPYAALPRLASRCFSRGITSFLSSDSECRQASGLCL